MKPLIQKRALSFLRERNIEKQLDTRVAEKIRRLSKCGIGRKLGVNRNTPLGDIPITGYEFYRPFFNNPNEGDFIHPLKDYVRTMTSGTMGRPKTYLSPITGFNNNLRSTGLSLFFISTFNEGKPELEFGDTIYANVPGGAFVASFISDAFVEQQSSLFKLVPPEMHTKSYKEKVDYFIQNYASVDLAYMTVTTFLDQICPFIEDEFYLKGLITQDSAAGPLKEEVKEKCGTYPRTVFGSTETLIAGIPSIEYPGAFFLDWRWIYPEFIPLDNTIDAGITTIEEPPETLSMMEIKVGERYQFIATPYQIDLTRYVMPDIFECISISDDELGVEVPIFNFYSRSDNMVTLHNFTRINEDELLTVLQAVDIPFVDFVAREEMIGSKEYLTLYLELREDLPGEEVRSRIHTELMDFDKDWRDLSTYFEYIPLKIKLLSNGTFNSYLEGKVGMARIARIGMREERFRQLLSYSEFNNSNSQ
jgi:hypothetical protein